MSAICGILSFGGLPPRLDALERMMRAMQRHGPDGNGSWHDASVALGQQMMHVTPESLNEQLPLHHSPSRLTLTMDGRLDNREDLLHALGLQGSRSLPDSALLLAAYQKWGKACAARVVGEFAFAVWDAGERSLHCFTDPMGVRPLFYRAAPGQFLAFASEVEPLLAVEPGRNSLNRNRLAMLGVSNLSVYLQPAATCFDHIYRVPAASVLSVTGGRKRIAGYWTPDPGKRLHFKSDTECKEAFRDVFFKAVKARLRSAFPVASLLSGGLDSSAIVSAAGQILAEENRRLVTLSSVPMPSAAGRVTDEREFVDLFQDKENLSMHFVSAPGCGPFDDLENLVKTASLCSYSYQHFLYTALVRTARENQARVILDGHGGEMSASCYIRGYMAELLLAGRWNTLLNELEHSSADRHIDLALVKRQLVRPFLPYVILKGLNRHNRFGILVNYPVQSSYIRAVLGRDADRIMDYVFRLPKEHPNHRRNMVEDMLLERTDLRQRSHAGFVDYQHAKFSYPFLDKRVLEFSLSVDGRFKHREGHSRHLLRLGMDGLLPEPIRLRTSKAPFSPDYHLRYEAEKAKARSVLHRFNGLGELNEIVDFKRVLRALETTTAYRGDKPMRIDRDPQFTIPYAVYLCYFLATFGS